MIRSKKLALVSFLTIFLAGLVLGVVLERLVIDKCQAKRQPSDPGEFLFQKFTTELSLDETQKLELRKLLADIKEKHRHIRKENRTQYKIIQEEFNTDFRKILSEEQLILFDQLVQEFEEKRARDKHNRRKDK